MLNAKFFEIFDENALIMKYLGVKFYTFPRLPLIK